MALSRLLFELKMEIKRRPPDDAQPGKLRFRYSLVGRKVMRKLTAAEKRSNAAVLAEVNQLLEAMDRGDGVDAWFVREFEEGGSMLIFSQKE